jgi:hypothetical protein
MAKFSVLCRLVAVKNAELPDRNRLETSYWQLATNNWQLFLDNWQLFPRMQG